MNDAGWVGERRGDGREAWGGMVHVHGSTSVFTSVELLRL